MENNKPLLSKFWYQIIIIFSIPVFFVGFMSLYNPLCFQDFLNLDFRGYQFHILMVYCILVGVLLMMRTILYLINRKVFFLWWHHMLWCIAEMYVASYFLALYITLMQEQDIPYFDAFGKCLGYLFLSLPFAYAIFILVHLIDSYSIRLENEHARQMGARMARFHDENGKLKLTVEKSSLIYIEAEFNYVNIHYMEGGKQKVFVLRKSMKSLERVADSIGLVRCHRSYFVNPLHVKSLSRDRDAQIYASLDDLEGKTVPVSKNYYNTLSSIL